MMRSYLTLALLLACLSSTAWAANVLEVKHNPGAGQFGSVQEAINTAVDGDTVEIIDNSAPFIESILLNRNAITLKGSDGLNPLPAIQSPDDGSDAAGGWALQMYDGTGCVIKNLKLRGGLWGCVWSLGGGLVTFQHCTIDAARSTAGAYGQWAIRMQTKPLVMENCQILHGTVYAFSMLDTGTAMVTNTTISDASGSGVGVEGPNTLTMRGCTIIRNGGFQVEFVKTADPTQTQHVTLNSTLIRRGNTSVGNPENPLMEYYTETADKSSRLALTLDNCDLVGSDRTSFGFLVAFGGQMTASFVNTIFYNLPTTFGLAATTTKPTATEDYCVYQLAPDDITNIGGVQGANSVLLFQDDPLYVNVANGDCHLVASSAAASLNSTGTPRYAGSQGIAGGAVNSAHNWSVFQ